MFQNSLMPEDLLGLWQLQSVGHLWSDAQNILRDEQVREKKPEDALMSEMKQHWQQYERHSFTYLVNDINDTWEALLLSNMSSSISRTLSCVVDEDKDENENENEDEEEEEDDDDDEQLAMAMVRGRPLNMGLQRSCSPSVQMVCFGQRIGQSIFHSISSPHVFVLSTLRIIPPL